MTNSSIDALCSLELGSKKSILEHIENVRKISIDTFSEEEWQEVYDFIYGSIEGLKEKVKPNTIHFLKNNLKSALAKRVLELDPVEENPFITFLKEAYPEKERGRDFLIALADHTKMRDDQILTTLKYISAEMKEYYTLDNKEREVIKEKIEVLRERRNLKALKQVKSLEGLRSDGSLERYIKKLTFS